MPQLPSFRDWLDAKGYPMPTTKAEVDSRRLEYLSEHVTENGEPTQTDTEPAS